MKGASDFLVHHGRRRPAGPVAMVIAGLTLAALCMTVSARTAMAQGQAVDFQVVWVVIGEAATADNKHAGRAGRQLFVASDLLEMTLHNIKVTRIDVEPVIMEIRVGEEICLSGLTMRAFGSDQQPIGGAPLSVAVRQDHKERLGLQRSKRDICVRPADAGEYPMRLTSLLPAPDGTMRGAQVFLRAKEPAAAAHQN
jgi:hypothetical protein